MTLEQLLIMQEAVNKRLVALVQRQSHIPPEVKVEFVEALEENIEQDKYLLTPRFIQAILAVASYMGGAA